MFRLIMILVFVAAVVFLATTLVAFGRTALGIARPLAEDEVPQTMQRVAYIALVILLFGLTTGWLGGI